MRKPNLGGSPLFAFATEMELSKVFSEVNLENVRCGELISLGDCNKGYAIILGVGLLNFSLNLSKALLECSRENVKISAVVNVGICGAYPERNCSVLDVVLVEHDCVGDLGFEMPDGTCTHWIERYDSSAVESAPGYIRDCILNLPAVSGTSVNCCTGSSATAIERARSLDCDIESMEGAACFAVCKKFSVPAFQIRAVSNLATTRDKAQWKISEALEKLCRLFHK